MLVNTHTQKHEWKWLTSQMLHILKFQSNWNFLKGHQHLSYERLLTIYILTTSLEWNILKNDYTLYNTLNPTKNNMYWVGQKVCSVFFHKLKGTFLIFTNNFINLAILTMSAVSCMVWRWLFSTSQFDPYQPQLLYLTMRSHPARNLQHETSRTTFDTLD